MSAPAAELVERFPGRRVLVVGDAILDAYLEGGAIRLCQEAPVAAIGLQQRVDEPGGAANAAANAAALGARTLLLAAIGGDADGDALERVLDARDVGTSLLVRSPARATVAKQRVVSGTQILVRLDSGTTEPLAAPDERALLDRLADAWPAVDAVLVSDYAKGTLTARVVAALERLQRAAPRVVVVDARDPGRYRTVAPTAVKPNHVEALDRLGAAPRRSARGRALWVASNGPRILERTGARIAAVTLDADGAVVLERGRPPHRTYARPASDATAVGAGDTFAATLTLALAAGADAQGAAEVATAAAGVVVGRARTTPCTLDELRAALAGRSKRVDAPDRLAAHLAAHRARGERVVFTNGCFDLLHRGHVSYLASAKALGDVLVVGLNDDESVRRLKGPARPLNPLDDRAEVLAALSCVDYVVPFAEDTPAALIEIVRPDVFVKGGDYTRATLPEADLVEALGGAVHLIPTVPERSTTGLIDRIRGGGRPLGLAGA
ncbi:MAG: D-glycero-beta-D-manno-heptose 1-phosphate adenylyltransferase [Thermoleophilia bacterium]